MILVLGWLAGVAGMVMVERFAHPRGPWLASSPGAVAFRLATAGVIYLFFYSWSWRPVFAAAATTVFCAVFVAINRGKQQFVHEPLVFADLAFLVDIFKHPRLFQTSFLGPLFVGGSVALILAAISLWWQIEPDGLAADAGVMARIWPVLALAMILAVVLLPGLRRLPERLALAVKTTAEAETDVARDGVLATLVIDFLCWRGDDRRPRSASSPYPRHVMGRTVDAAPLVVVVQAESFFDFRRLPGGETPLPALDSARKKSVAWGTLDCAFAGGYTMRSEFSLLTGIAPDALGFDRYYPYLAARHYGSVAMPALLRTAGYATVFIHPYNREFFWRDRGLPALGFETIETIETFAGAPSIGGFVADAAVAERVIAAAERHAGAPAFLFAATIESHGPWEPGRFEGLDHPVDIFKEHLRNADAMLGRLIATFEAAPHRVVLLFYGDHVPLLKAYADPFPDARTDYVLLELGARARSAQPVVERHRAVHELGLDLMRQILL